MFTITNPEGLEAILAHEMAPNKLLGEDRLKENDEFLTDLTTALTSQKARHTWKKISANYQFRNFIYRPAAHNS